MGMSTSVVGIKLPDEKWKQMKAIWDACEAAGVEVPDEVDDFFNGETPDSRGVLLTKSQLGEAVEPYQDDYSSGYIVHLDYLPRDVRMIKFKNSW